MPSEILWLWAAIAIEVDNYIFSTFIATFIALHVNIDNYLQLATVDICSVCLAGQ